MHHIFESIRLDTCRHAGKKYKEHGRERIPNCYAKVNYKNDSQKERQSEGCKHEEIRHTKHEPTKNSLLDQLWKDSI
jgi:hypothetical protein